MNKQFGTNVKVRGFSKSNLRAYPVFIFEFYGFKGDVPAIVIDDSQLTGGKDGTVPRAVVTTVRQGSNNLLFEPINS